MFSYERLTDPEVRRLLGRIHLGHDTTADALYFNEQRLLYTVEIQLTDGRRFSRESSSSPVIDQLDQLDDLDDLDGALVPASSR